MDVKEDGAIAFAKWRSVYAVEWPADFVEDARGNMPGNDRVGNPEQPTVPQVHVGAAHLGSDRPQQRAPRWQFGSIEFADLDGTPRTGHDCGEDAVTHGVRYPVRAGQ
jgi:hypothetical protein